MKDYYVYIIANKKNGTLYTGVTSDLSKRIAEHKDKVGNGFARKYELDRLVYCEEHEDVYEAIEREKKVKRWKRSWKIELIEIDNPEWRDLSEGIS